MAINYTIRYQLYKCHWPPSAYSFAYFSVNSEFGWRKRGSLLSPNFFGRTDAKAETPVLWPPHEKGWLIGKDSDAGRDWGQKEKGTTEDEMAGCHHWLHGHESGWTPGVGDGQGGLACCNSWGSKESDTTEWLNWTELGLGNILEFRNHKVWMWSRYCFKTTARC